YGNEIQNIDIDDSEGFKITIPVFKLAKLPVDVEITNIPDGIKKEEMNITYSVKELSIAGEAKTVDNLSALSIGTIDFSELKNTKNVFRFDPGTIAGIKLKSDVEVIEVTIDLSSFKSKEVTIPTSAIEINNATDLKATITDKNVSVTIAGNSESLESLSASDFSASVKIDEKMTAGEGKKAELTVVMPEVSGIWVIGSYTVTVSLA
ncbi:MAG: hypothetical protein IKE65_09595, partial [Clostridia bacterium]|nr:hypothetical protein [Clostridia bacterium]